jgi:hypothetical protein
MTDGGLKGLILSRVQRYSIEQNLEREISYTTNILVTISRFSTNT